MQKELVPQWMSCPWALGKGLSCWLGHRRCRMSLGQLSPSAVAVAGCHQAAFSQPIRALQSHPMARSLPPYRTSNKSAFGEKATKIRAKCCSKWLTFFTSGSSWDCIKSSRGFAGSSFSDKSDKWPLWVFVSKRWDLGGDKIQWWLWSDLKAIIQIHFPPPRYQDLCKWERYVWRNMKEHKFLNHFEAHCKARWPTNLRFFFCLKT